MKLVLFKGKARPLGFITPGGYMKTRKGWVKVKGREGAQQAPQKDVKYHEHHRVDIIPKDGMYYVRVQNTMASGKKPTQMFGPFEDEKIAKGYADSLQKKVGEQAKRTLTVEKKPLKEKRKVGHVTKGGYVKTEKGWRKAPKHMLTVGGETSQKPKLVVTKPESEKVKEDKVSSLESDLRKFEDEFTRYRNIKWGKQGDPEKAKIEMEAFEERAATMGSNIKTLEDVLAYGRIVSTENKKSAWQITKLQSGVSKAVRDLMNKEETAQGLQNLYVKLRDGGLDVGGAINQQRNNRFKKLSPSEKLVAINDPKLQAMANQALKKTEISALKVQESKGVDIEEEDLDKVYFNPELEKLSKKEFNAFVSSRFKQLYGISVTGFPKDSKRQLAYVDNILRKLPVKMTKKNSLWKHLKYAKKDAANSQTWAYYSRFKSTVVLYDHSDDTKSRQEFDFNDTNTVFGSCLYHEVGHSLHHRIEATKEGKALLQEFAELAGWKKEGWQSFKDVSKSSEELVTEYARTNPKEAFAEYFAIYTINKKQIDEYMGEKYPFPLSIPTYRKHRAVIDKDYEGGNDYKNNYNLFKFMRDKVYGSKLFKSWILGLGV